MRISYYKILDREFKIIREYLYQEIGVSLNIKDIISHVIHKTKIYPEDYLPSTAKNIEKNMFPIKSIDIDDMISRELKEIKKGISGLLPNMPLLITTLVKNYAVNVHKKINRHHLHH